MPKLDQKDIEILQLLQEDSRRPYSEIAKKVDLSPPTVSDRIERLEAQGAIKRMTIDIDREMLDRWDSLLIELTPTSKSAERVEDQLLECKYTQEVIRTAEGILTVKMRGPIEEVQEYLREEMALSPGEIAEVSMVSSIEQSPPLPKEIIESEKQAPTFR